MRRLTAIAATAAVGLTTSAAALAQAGAFPSNVTIGYARGAHLFSGQVSSSQPPCVRGRPVTVFRRKAGADPAVGTDRAAAGGSWRVHLGGAPKPGYYYAKARAITVGPAGSRTVCTAAKSAVTRAS